MAQRMHELGVAHSSLGLGRIDRMYFHGSGWKKDAEFRSECGCGARQPRLLPPFQWRSGCGSTRIPISGIRRTDDQR